jgi:hypothetical protein
MRAIAKDCGVELIEVAGTPESAAMALVAYLEPASL